MANNTTTSALRAALKHIQSNVCDTDLIPEQDYLEITQTEI